MAASSKSHPGDDDLLETIWKPFKMCLTFIWIHPQVKLKIVLKYSRDCALYLMFALCHIHALLAILVS